MKHNLETYLNEFETLTPTDTQVGSAVVQSEWWNPLKDQFDNLIWLYYPQRTIFLNDRFSPEDSQQTYDNIIKTFTIWIKSHKRQLDRLWVGYMADFNPLWNVDGVEGFVSQDTHTGTTTNTHTGDDRLTYEDNGSDTLTNSGTDTDTRAVTTFDDVANFKNESRDSVAHGKIATDVKDLDGYKNQNYDSEMETEHDLLDEHVDMKIRQGNIGLTKSTDLLESNLAMYSNERFDFYRYIVKSCVNQVSYAIEGVL